MQQLDPTDVQWRRLHSTIREEQLAVVAATVVGDMAAYRSLWNHLLDYLGVEHILLVHLDHRLQWE